jgi:hypothetical protein
MNNVSHKTTNILFAVLFVVWLVYAWFTLTIAPSPESIARFGEAGIFWLQVAIAFSLLGIWGFALFAATRFNEYAHSIRESADGKAFSYIANGLFFLVGSMVLSTVISTTMNYFISLSPEMRAAYMKFFTIFRNYETLALSIVAYYLMYAGTKKLLDIAGSKITKKQFIASVLLPLVVLGGLYFVLLFQNEYRTVSDNPNINPTYYLSDPLIIATVAIPYVLIWFFGLASGLQALVFSRNVSGIIYKSALRNFTIGILLVIYLGIGLQLLGQVGTVFANTGIVGISVLIAVILGVILAGYGYIARGARALSKLESAVGGGALK